ncbi:MAG: carboxypeptidase regulatory-like domain-containing protein, partial [Verrucomicrobiales bacterium]|nr:carboxypeptidase regulatory-like domain-containing protein [Verrucomicrobiales bacterium]
MFYPYALRFRLFLAACLCLVGLGRGVRGEGTVATASTSALVEALRGGGLVTLTFAETLIVETPILITADTTLVGAGSGGRTVTLSGGGVRRILQVLPGVRLEISQCILRDAVAASGAGIANEGTLVASNVTFIACKAIGASGAAGLAGENLPGVGGNGTGGADGFPAGGGAVENQGTARLVECIFQGNQALGGQGGKGGDRGLGGFRLGHGGDGGRGAAAWGGALWNAGTMELERCLFTANSAEGGDGGAGGSEAAILGAGQGGPGAEGAGGAVFSTGWLTVDRCSFATNLVTGGIGARAGATLESLGRDGATGGAARGGAIAWWGEGWVVNTTFYTNLMAGGNGGNGVAGTFTSGDGGAGGDGLGAAIHVLGSVALTNVTLAWNTGTNGIGGTAGDSFFGEAGAAGRRGGSALAVEAPGRAVVINSILASTELTTVHGEVSDAGHNLFSDAGTPTAGPGSVRGAHPRLSGFQVWTQGLPGLQPLVLSPAIDLADAMASPKWDQRGLSRLDGAGPDAGALEASLTRWSLSGVVRAAGVGLGGVPVRVTGTVAGSEVAYDLVTREDGTFRLADLPPAIYLVVPGISGAGYQPPLAQVGLSADVSNLVFERTAPSLQATRDTV